jgi:hypothetical protein
VGDDEHGDTPSDAGHIALDGGFGLIVQRAVNFVEDQDARVGKRDAADGDGLALPAA